MSHTTCDQIIDSAGMPVYPYPSHKLGEGSPSSVSYQVAMTPPPSQFRIVSPARYSRAGKQLAREVKQGVSGDVNNIAQHPSELPPLKGLTISVEEPVTITWTRHISPAVDEIPAATDPSKKFCYQWSLEFSVTAKGIERLEEDTDEIDKKIEEATFAIINGRNQRANASKDEKAKNTKTEAKNPETKKSSKRKWFQIRTDIGHFRTFNCRQPSLPSDFLEAPAETGATARSAAKRNENRGNRKGGYRNLKMRRGALYIILQPGAYSMVLRTKYGLVHDHVSLVGVRFPELAVEKDITAPELWDDGLGDPVDIFAELDSRNYQSTTLGVYDETRGMTPLDTLQQEAEDDDDEA
ncbi:hypothetical protein CSOJ01_06907 [Colletotrichum sojae]|uniref:Uncharacterized protein n=1 Tax=Colletotrichum sojae TaxID=2175907 RepID=A0A8H6JA83_9PEZI|nr:hypothetical protein CSOJ01_06907 [Colletotrichum sojae]